MSPRRANPDITKLFGYEPREGRCEGLVVVRESDEKDDQLFDGIREQTYRQPHLPAAARAIHAAGMTPLERGCRQFTLTEKGGRKNRQVTVAVHHLRRGATRAIAFYYAGYWHLWSKSSAAKLTADGENEFTMLLIGAIKEYRPRVLHAANISRLVRSHWQADKLKDAMHGVVEEVDAGMMRFPLVGPGAVNGHVLLSTLAMAAAVERDAIVQRTQAGRVAKWRRGEWPLGENTVPFGYHLDPKTKRLKVDEDAIPAVRQMLQILCGSHSPAVMQQKLGEAGVLSMRKHERGQRVKVSQLTSAEALLTRLYAYAAVYISGEHLFRLSNCFRDIEELAGVKVSRYTPGDNGELQMLTSVPLPEGGWAPPHVLEAYGRRAVEHNAMLLAQGRSPVRPLSAAVRETSVNAHLHSVLMSPVAAAGNDARQQAKRVTSRARRRVAPLTGRQWTADGSALMLQSLANGRYRLWQWDPKRTRDTLRPAAHPSER